MTREGLIDIVEQAIDVMASASFPGSCGREVTSINNPRETAIAALAAIEAAGVRLVPVEATTDMQNAAAPLLAEVNSIIVAHAARTGGSGLKIPVSLADIYAAMRAASPYAPQKDESHE